VDWQPSLDRPLLDPRYPRRARQVKHFGCRGVREGRTVACEGKRQENPQNEHDGESLTDRHTADQECLFLSTDPPASPFARSQWIAFLRAVSYLQRTTRLLADRASAIRLVFLWAGPFGRRALAPPRLIKSVVVSCLPDLALGRTNPVTTFMVQVEPRRTSRPSHDPQSHTTGTPYPYAPARCLATHRPCSRPAPLAKARGPSYWRRK
jgi:hypothetical protein